MKRMSKVCWIILLFVPCFVISTHAATVEDFQQSIENLRGTMSDDLLKELDELGVSADLHTLNNLNMQSVAELLYNAISKSAAAPLWAGSMTLAAVMIAALLESYTDSLRYTSTKEVMGAVTALSASILILTPILSLLQQASQVIRGACSLMLLYIPIMIGMLAFSGGMTGFMGQYGLMMTVCESISTLSSTCVIPMIGAYLGLGVSSCLSARLRLSSFCDVYSKVIKWLITFMMTVFSSVLALRSVITGAFDSVTTRAVRFTLSSFIPLVGAAISEAYRTLSASMNILRSGAGVFIIIALLVGFLPIFVRGVLWMLSISVCRSVAELSGVTSVGSVLGCVNSALSMLMAICASVVTIFVISSAVLMMLGGSA